MTTEREPIHLLMRFSDKLGAIEDTIEAHVAVIRRKGCVWFGKMGKTLAQEKIDRINEQCATDVATCLYLVQKNAKTYQVFCGSVLRVSKALPRGQVAYVPRYYEAHGLLKYMRLWVRLTGLHQASLADLGNLRVVTSGGNMRETLRTSMAAMFVIKKTSTASTTVL